jgi:hypothetical protein
MRVRFLRTRRRERVQNCILRLFQVRQTKYCFSPVSVCLSFSDVPYWRPPAPRSVWSFIQKLMVSKPVSGQFPWPPCGSSQIRRFAWFRYVLATLHARPHSSRIVQPQPCLQILAIPPA